MAQPHRHRINGVGPSPDPSTVTLLVAGHSGGGTLVRIVGRLDVHSAPRLATELAAASRLPRRGPPRMTLDLSGVTFLDDAGLQVLLDLQDRLVAQSGELELQSPTAAVVGMLHEAHLQGSSPPPDRRTGAAGAR